MHKVFLYTVRFDVQERLIIQGIGIKNQMFARDNLYRKGLTA